MTRITFVLAAAGLLAAAGTVTAGPVIGPSGLCGCNLSPTWGNPELGPGRFLSVPGPSDAPPGRFLSVPAAFPAPLPAATPPLVMPAPKPVPEKK
jgi:hypothetical protein